MAASCFFYMWFKPVYILILLVTILIDYTAGLMIHRYRLQPRKRKGWLIASIVSTLSVLFIFKYQGLFYETNILLPIGLSFHTFQSLSYVIEVYRGNQRPERHFGFYSLYVMFYPQLVTGPIERPQNLLRQLHIPQPFQMQNLARGVMLILFGLFAKMVVADDLAVYVDQIYAQPDQYGSAAIALGLFFYSFQIYCDFFGYSTIALGCAKAMGYVYAVKNGKGGFVNLKNGAETGFTFLESAGKSRAGFIIVEDPREGTILISAEAGELPGRYKEADVPYNSAAMLATVTEMDGRIHVIDGFGNDALPDQPEIQSTYNVTYSKDGSLILVRDANRVYHIYKVTRTEEPEANPDGNEDGTGENKPEGTEGETKEEPGSWTCENGHGGNTGKFCSECGAAKPVEEDNGPWTCVNGHEGNTGKFCTECGSPKPQN